MSNEKNSSVERFFELKPFKAGKISEISETTAASPVPAEERINFHIGNPALDERLIHSYLKIILGLSEEAEINPSDLKSLCETLGVSAKESGKISFFYNLIKNSVTYSPRGGYRVKTPIPLIKSIHHWLTEGQEESLSYDLGDKSGKRELIISSGGKEESLRILMHAINLFLVHLPVNFFFWNFPIPRTASDINAINSMQLQGNELELLPAVKDSFKQNASQPVFLVLGALLSENTRRGLSKISRKYPLYFVEVSDAPNHLSFAREAGLKSNVLRILSMSFLVKKLQNTSIAILCGDFDLLRIFEAVHFQLKGTPSASDIELMQYCINNAEIFTKKNGSAPANDFSNMSQDNSILNKLENHSEDLLKRVDKIVSGTQIKIEALANNIQAVLDRTQSYIQRPDDSFMQYSAFELFDELLANLGNPDWARKIIASAQYVFCKEHPEYKAENTYLVSGSSRTALGLLGFHCGIEEVIGCDLSWNYEHCFPRNVAIPLTDDYELDAPAICCAIEESKSASYKSAVVLNNPHNATGKAFVEKDIAEIVISALRNGLFVIDDLAYQNVIAKPELSGPKTLKQLALELVKQGKITKEDLQRVISVHSLSKTDCIAGARLAFVEISEPDIASRFKMISKSMNCNIAAVFMAYLFYRSDSSRTYSFWKLRNIVLYEKMKAMETALSELPAERNPFHIDIIAPEASMYPRMVINELPNGLSLDWLSTELAALGIGMIPLSSFARTKHGYELARKVFRLTLGGADSAETILRKTRKALIELNRIVADEKIKYIRHSFSVAPISSSISDQINSSNVYWRQFVSQVNANAQQIIEQRQKIESSVESNEPYRKKFLTSYLPWRLEHYNGVLKDFIRGSSEMSRMLTSNTGMLEERLATEFFKDSLSRRMDAFRSRLYDRTVHPTQLFAIEPDSLFDPISKNLIFGKSIDRNLIEKFSSAIADEYFGKNININSIQESDEVLCDLRSIVASENFTEFQTGNNAISLLSYWGDWDGSNRPSGQGHRLVASVLIENVNLLASILNSLIKIDKNAKPSTEIQSALSRLDQDTHEFSALLNHITSLTNQLEKRFKGLLPFTMQTNPIQKIGIGLKILKDPLVKLWQHNDRLEHKMIALRNERKQKLEYYFRLNKQLRKTLYDLIPLIKEHSQNRQLMMNVALYRDLLKRFVLTPRILQKLITTKDQFAINTTVHNIVEINEIAGNYGNPGMILGLQVSMSSQPEALISLDRKLQTARQDVVKRSESEIANVWSIPLFEDIKSVTNIDSYMDSIWSYAQQSREINQEVRDRFTEIFCESFIAGSDLSQQIGQTKSALLFKQAKFKIIEWLAKRGLTDVVRVKLGSGEPMQRMGGYYAEFSGVPAFILDKDSDGRFESHLRQSTIKSTEFAVSPLHGAFAGRDLRTLQSAISEKVRMLSLTERSQFLYHLREAQESYRVELKRAAEPFINTRFQYETRGIKELEKLAIGRVDETFLTFADMVSKNFQDITYGSEDDVVGVHIISYFLSRAMPILRDRPVERTTQGDSADKGRKILERIASTIPLRKHGSLLRAIAHNKSQTFVLGLNQLTTGLFRSLQQFSQMEYQGDSGSILIAEKILPQLPVYEILSTLRLFEDKEMFYLSKFYECFPTGFRAFSMIREDRDAMFKYIPQLQKELLRRHGVSVGEFFEGDAFIEELLPTLRPDLAVLLQSDFFNTDKEKLFAKIGGKISSSWMKEVSDLLDIPKRIAKWRKRIWDVLADQVKNQTSSFVELSIALNAMATNFDLKDMPFSQPADKKGKVESNLVELFKGKVEDSMQQFLSAVVQYLSSLPSENVEAPIDIVRALKDVESILRIDASALTKEKQESLNFYVTQISRLAGDNG